MEFIPGEKTVDGYLALPPSGAGPGVLILHAWWGLNGFFVEMCERIAAEGYVALAPDLFDGAVASTVAEAEALSALSEGPALEATKRKALTALDVLVRHPALQGGRIGVLGCSYGGWWAIQLSVDRPEEIAAAVLVYGVGDADFAAARCAYQGHFAENDAFDSLDVARAMAADMRAAGREVDYHEYQGVGHWFFESNQPDAYDADSAALVWTRTIAFLKTHLNR